MFSPPQSWASCPAGSYSAVPDTFDRLIVRLVQRYAIELGTCGGVTISLDETEETHSKVAALSTLLSHNSLSVRRRIA